MIYRLHDVDLFESFCADPSADNCYEFADGALPVYLDTSDDGEPVLTTTTGRPDRPYGYLYTLYDKGDSERTVVVRM
jgi:hypothetical protein